MSIDNLFPTITIQQTELDIVAEKLGDPLVKRYLRSLALESAKEFLTLSKIKTPEYGVIQASAVVQGRLDVLGTLLSIQDQTDKESQQ